MEGEGDKWQQCSEDVALNIPLIAEHEGSQISGNNPSNNVTTSFLKTCFNGLNALSASWNRTKNHATSFHQRN
ncbi:hypothetical protein MTR_7g010760 [Medicago truncatula]|uniref:Uncharacterized protein n=1 Tax=Medicago truncatula TaxID=3880 RepID=Q2HUT1_MEDTR|nr:hypothetical protein MtrDRAFT_AC149128g3v2 [Medicago truncatula]AES77450.1 hypothetical protein MTR_7g010760 [Medicago truncatula]